MAVIGKNFAILEAGRIRISGFLARLAWAFVHMVALPLRQNRMRVRIQWLLVLLYRATQLAADFRSPTLGKLAWNLRWQHGVRACNGGTHLRVARISRRFVSLDLSSGGSPCTIIAPIIESQG